MVAMGSGPVEVAAWRFEVHEVGKNEYKHSKRKLKLQSAYIRSKILSIFKVRKKMVQVSGAGVCLEGGLLTFYSFFLDWISFFFLFSFDFCLLILLTNDILLACLYRPHRPRRPRRVLVTITMLGVPTGCLATPNPHHHHPTRPQWVFGHS